MLRRRGLLAPLVLLALLAGPAGARAEWSGLTVDGIPADHLGTHGDEHVDLPPLSGGRTGYATGIHSSAANAGDVDGDGHDDVVALRFSVSPDPTSAYVAFTRPGRTAPRRADRLGADGLHVRLPTHAFPSITSVGDLDRDGADDIAFQLPSTIVVVFGRSRGGEADAAAGSPDAYHIPITWPDGGGADTGMRQVVAVGDQTGDGRPDLAVAEAVRVRLVPTPADPRGATADVDDAHTALLETPLTAPSESGLRLAAVEDLDGDERRDLVVGWSQDRRALLYASALPVVGQRRTLESMVDDRRALRFAARVDWPIGLVHALGDQDGDGRDELAATWSPEGHPGSRLFVVRTPVGAMGTRRTVPALPAATMGFTLYTGHQNVVPVGDQDADGSEDVASGLDVAYLTDAVRARLHQTRGQGFGPRPPGFHFIDSSDAFPTIVDRIGDVNGDRRPELVVLRDDQYSPGHPVAVDLFYSAPPPAVGTPEPPVVDPVEDEVEVAAPVITRTASRTVAQRAEVRFTAPDGAAVVLRTAATRVAAGRRLVRFTVPVGSATARATAGAPRLRPGTRYRYRVAVQNGRGEQATAPERTVTTPGADGRRSRLKLSVRPGRAVVGRRVRLRARVTLHGAAVRGAVVRLGRRRVRTDRRGRARITVRLRRAGRVRVEATLDGAAPARRMLRVDRRRS